jgi:hypothetical protein
MNKKYEELKRQKEALELEKARISNEIRECLTKELEIHALSKEKVRQLYEWQQPDSGSYSKFQIIHLLITAIAGLVLGGYFVQEAPLLFKM